MLWSAYDIQECSNDNVILYAVSKDGGEQWSDPEVFMAAPNAMVSHVYQVQFRDSEKVLMVSREGNFVGAEVDSKTRNVVKWADYGRSPMHIVIRRSLDDGNTWEPGRELPPELIVPGYRPPFYGAPEALLELQSGKTLMAVCYLPPEKRDPQHFNVSFLLSEDQGETWSRTHVLTVREQRGAMEPTIVELERDELYCLLRNKSGYLYETASHDGGCNWTKPRKTKIPSPEAICRILKLQSGRVLLVWNNQSSATQAPRYPLVAAYSQDGCKTWSEPRVIATETGANQLSNFGLIQVRDGRILLGISHYRATQPSSSDLELAVLDEGWVLKGG